MYWRSDSVWPWRPMSRPGSSVFTSSRMPSSMGCSSTVAGKPRSSRSFSRVALDGAGIGWVRFESWWLIVVFALRLSFLFLHRRQDRRRRRNRRTGFGQLRLRDAQQVLHGPVKRQAGGIVVEYEQEHQRHV